jgi:hypothetical protein
MLTRRESGPPHVALIVKSQMKIEISSVNG